MHLFSRVSRDRSLSSDDAHVGRLERSQQSSTPRLIEQPDWSGELDPTTLYQCLLRGQSCFYLAVSRIVRSRLPGAIRLDSRSVLSPDEQTQARLFFYSDSRMSSVCLCYLRISMFERSCHLLRCDTRCGYTRGSLESLVGFLHAMLPMLCHAVLGKRWVCPWCVLTLIRYEPSGFFRAW